VALFPLFLFLELVVSLSEEDAKIRPCEKPKGGNPLQKFFLLPQHHKICPQCEEIWQHFVHEIMGQDPQDPLYLALAPFCHELPQVLITLNLPTLDSLTYLKPDETDPTNNPPTTTYLAEHHKQLVCIFGNWIAYCAYTGLQNDNTVDGWKSLTHADFNNFHVNGYHNFQSPIIMPQLQLSHHHLVLLLVHVLLLIQSLNLKRELSVI